VVHAITLNLPEVILDVSAETGMVAATADQTTVLIYSVQSSIVKQQKETTGILFAASFSPDSRKLASASLDGTARIWQVAP